MILEPFFGYYGSKYSLARFYPKPKFDTIVEPFAGGAGYALRHYHSKVVLYDKDPIIATIWRYIIKGNISDFSLIPTKLKDGQKINDLSICQEAKWLMGFWVNSGVSAPCQRLSQWLKNSRRLADMKCRLIIQHEMIKHWKVSRRSYDDIKPRRATWFIDPPYQDMGVHYQYSSKDINFSRLGEWCRSQLGQVIVCENVGANWLPFRPFHRIKSIKGYSTEVIYTQ